MGAYVVASEMTVCDHGHTPSTNTTRTDSSQVIRRRATIGCIVPEKLDDLEEIALFPLAIHGGPLWEPMCYAQSEASQQQLS